MNYTKIPGASFVPAASATAGSDNGEIPAQLHCLNVALDDAEQQLALLADHMESVLQPSQPKGPSEAICGSTQPIATPLGASIQSARLQVERITNRMIDIRIRIGL